MHNTSKRHAVPKAKVTNKRETYLIEIYVYCWKLSLMVTSPANPPFFVALMRRGFEIKVSKAWQVNIFLYTYTVHRVASCSFLSQSCIDYWYKRISASDVQLVGAYVRAFAYIDFRYIRLEENSLLWILVSFILKDGMRWCSNLVSGKRRK